VVSSYANGDEIDAKPLVGGGCMIMSARSSLMGAEIMAEKCLDHHLVDGRSIKGRIVNYR
jgi:hypothetical protein